MMSRMLLYLLVVGAVIRLVLFPLPFGDDFADWMLDLDNIFSGGFLYHYPLPVDGKFVMGGLEYNYTPFSKPPFFIYLMVPLRYFSLYSGISLSFLAKFMFLLSDLGVSYLIYSFLLSKNISEKSALFGMSLFLFNPLVIYLSAVYGKFDSIVLFFLMLALRNIAKSRFSLYYAVSFATKPFTLFVLPWFLFRKRLKWGRIIVSVLIFLIIMLPYLLYDYTVLGDIFLQHYNKTPRGFSWMLMLSIFEYGTVRVITSLMFILYFLMLVLIAFLFDVSIYTYSALVFTLFLVFNGVVWEQYLIWGLPFLSILYVLKRSRMALVLVIAYSAAGIMFNNHIQLFDLVGLIVTNLCLLLLTLLFVGTVLLTRDYKLKRVLD